MKKKHNLQDEFSLALAPFTPEKGELRDWGIETVAGPLELMLCDTDGMGPWIACIFTDPKRAREHFGVKEWDFGSSRLNPYAGKWNWHWQEFAVHGVRPSKSEMQAAGRRMVTAFFQEIQRTLQPGDKQ